MNLVGTEKTLESEVRRLLDDLCVELGFCLPSDERDTLQRNPPRDLDAFTDAVFAAEEMDPGLYKGLRQAVRHKIEQRVGYWMAGPPDARPDRLQFRGTTIAVAGPPIQRFVGGQENTISAAEAYDWSGTGQPRQ
jgi:hypothetical protein